MMKNVFYYVPQEAIKSHVLSLLEQIIFGAFPSRVQNVACFFSNDRAHLVQILHSKR